LVLWAGSAPAQELTAPPRSLPALTTTPLPPRPQPVSGVEGVLGVRQTALVQQPGYGSDEVVEYTIQLTPPGPERLFRLESQASLMLRMKQEALQRTPPERIEFPEEQPLSKEAWVGRHWPRRDMLIEPDYVCYKKLLFEDPMAERYGWDLGPVQPLLSTAGFLGNFVTVPYHLGADPCRTEVSAGRCYPGDPVPYLIYPPELSVSGLAAEAATAVLLFVTFP
jgi:hypothetical protein